MKETAKEQRRKDKELRESVTLQWTTVVLTRYRDEE